jgi:hypothetical protein
VAAAALAGLLVLLAVTDRVAARVAAGRLAARADCLGARPEVSLGGVPFLTQLATGRLAEVRAETTVPFAELATAAKRDATFRAADGALVVESTATLGGREVPVTVHARPALEGGALTLTPEWVEVLGFRTDGAALPGLRATAGLRRPLPALPDGFGYTSVAVADDGLRVAVTGHDVAVRRGGASGTGICGNRP